MIRYRLQLLALLGVLALLLAGGLAGWGPADLAQALGPPPPATPRPPTATAVPPTATLLPVDEPRPPTAIPVPPTVPPLPAEPPLPPTETPVPVALVPAPDAGAAGAIAQGLLSADPAAPAAAAPNATAPDDAPAGAMPVAGALGVDTPVDGATEPLLRPDTTGLTAPDGSAGDATVQRTPTPRRPPPTATVRRPPPTATVRRAAPTTTTRPAGAGLPGRVLLPMPNFEYQKMNNCGPCVTLMALSVMGIETSQQRIADVMRPNTGDKNVSAEEVVAYLGRYNLQSRVMVGVDVQRLRRLTAAGIPVIVEQLLATNDDISHFRLVRGYDDSKQVLITGDSYYAATYNINYKTFEQLSRMFNHRYMPVWRADQAATVQAILGDDWDPTVMYAHARDQAQAAVQASPNDAAWWLALGHSQYGLGNWDAAIRAYLKSVSLGGLTKRVLWYQWWPVTALNRAGRYSEAITWADGAIRSAGVYAEMRYERAFALHALGRNAEAITELKQAVVDDPNYLPAKQLLAQISGQ